MTAGIQRPGAWVGSPWQLLRPHAWRDARAPVRAVQWLVDEGLIEEDAAQRFKGDHREPSLP